MNITKEFGLKIFNEIERVRKKKGYSQRELARRLGQHETTVTQQLKRLKHNSSHIETIESYALALDCEINFVLKEFPEYE